MKGKQQEVLYSPQNIKISTRESVCYNPLYEGCFKYDNLSIYFIFSVEPGSVKVFGPVKVYYGDLVSLTCVSEPSLPGVEYYLNSNFSL